MERARGCNANGNSTLLSSRRPSCRFDCVIELCEYDAGILEEGAPCVGQLNTTRLAVKLFYTKFPFVCLDPLAQWRLLHAEPFRGPGDMPLLGDRDKISELPQVHFHIKTNMIFASLLAWLVALGNAIHSKRCCRDRL